VSAHETASPHIPVMLREVLEALAPKDGGIYVDGTFGAGGYTRAILNEADCQVYAIDRDPAALSRGRAIEEEFGGRLTLVEGCFGNMEALLHERGVAAVDGVALDVGVSSMQLDEAERGFSFSSDGPLDMRMGGEGPSAADVVNTFEEKDLARIISVYGEEKKARAVARAIGRARATKEITRTGELADIVASAVGGRGASRIHPATRTFQALRIFVNDELRELARGLSGAEHLLREGGRLAVVAFHSLEDRIVKRFLAERAGASRTVSRHMPLPEAGPAASFDLLFRGAEAASDEEAGVNPRARSAKLRAGVRTDAAPQALDLDALGMSRMPVLQGGAA